MNKGNNIKSLIPLKVRIFLGDFFGLATIHRRIDRLEEYIHESKESLWNISRERWRQAEPTDALTWGRMLTGDGFIAKVSSYEVFDHEKSILEIGVGYGRLLKACIEQKIPFKNYYGVDLSVKNVKHLQDIFPVANINIIQGDAEKVSFDARFDVVLSSLTFKHLFPSFENTLRNVVNYVNPGGMFFFDLIEGKNRYFEDDAVTYIRWYTRSEILQILDAVSLELVSFDQVQHDTDHSRLLVVVRKPK
jgi:SAM-dependent methyltransferase